MMTANARVAHWDKSVALGVQSQAGEGEMACEARCRMWYRGKGLRFANPIT